MDPDSEHFENQTDVEWPNPPKIIKMEYGNNVEITLDMVMPKMEENSEDTSFGVMQKKPNLQKEIVQISPKEKHNAETFEAKDKSVYLEVVKQNPQNLPNPRKKLMVKHCLPQRNRKLHQKGKQKCLGSLSKNVWMFMI